MIEQDTVRLLRECDAGIKMGISSIYDVLNKVESPKLYKILESNKGQHEELQGEIQGLLGRYHDEGKQPSKMASAMSKMKTGMKMTMDYSDATIADLMTDGCNMGVKSLNKYLNQYEAADEVSKDITKRLINLEEELTHQIRCFL